MSGTGALMVGSSTGGSKTKAAVLREPLFRSLPAMPGSRAVDQALKQASNQLWDLQHADGHWCGELQGDSILESEYLLLKFILGQENEPALPKIANYLRRLQTSSGGWSLYPGGPDDLSASV